MTELVPRVWTYINAFQVKNKCVLYKLRVFFHPVLISFIVYCDMSAFLLLFCNLSTFFSLLVLKLEIPQGMPCDFSELGTGFLWSMLLWPHCSQSGAFGWLLKVTCWQSWENVTSGDVGILICQISRMDPKAQNVLWRATFDSFSFTFGFVCTGWRMEFQHDPIKSRMLFQRLDYLFAELNHMSACKICNGQINGQISNI